MINIETFNKTWQMMNEKKLKMDTLNIQCGEQKLKHVFGEQETYANIRSLCKPITCICYGIAIDQGYFKNGLNELVYPYLKQTQNIVSKINLSYIKKWTIKTLLTLTIGCETKMLDTKHLETINGQNYADVVLNSFICHEPGEYFLYSNASMYLASVVFQNAVGVKLVDFANKYLFGLLDVAPVVWKESPQGYNMGCTGISMYSDDVVKLGLLILQRGIYNNKRVVSETWINEMLTPQVSTPMMYDEKRVLPKFSYGLNMWICKDGIAYCDGTDGQYLIIVPNKNLVIVTTGHQSNMKPITECLLEIIRGD